MKKLLKVFAALGALTCAVLGILYAKDYFSSQDEEDTEDELFEEEDEDFDLDDDLGEVPKRSYVTLNRAETADAD